jgi:type IV secretion system protein VirD4
MTTTRIRRRHSRPHPGAVSALGLATLALQQLIASLGAVATPLTLIGLAGFTAAAGGAGSLAHRHSPRGRVRRQYGHDGWITRRRLREDLGRNAVRAKGVDVRASLAALPPVQLRKLPDREFGKTIGRSVTGPAVPRKILFPHKEVAMVYAPPQTGKTALLGNWIIDAPGAVISTSTKIDAWEYTAPVRAAQPGAGRISVFNPEGLGDVPSTFRWDPTSGCENVVIAQERASYHVSGASDKGAKDAKFWEDQAVSVLRCYLMAAALDGRNMSDVSAWVANSDDNTPERILEGFPHIVPSGWLDGLAHVKGPATPVNTRGSIFITLRLAVAYMGDPAVARACMPNKNEPTFDVEEFINTKGSLYLIGSETAHSTIAPLLTALTGYIFEECKRIAARVPGRRLDPPVTFILDEAALIVPVPLAQWTSDAGGRGISIVFAVQSPSQLVQRWGEKAAETIRNNAVVKVIFGGLSETRDLEAICAVAGMRKEDSVSESLESGGRVPRSVTQHHVRTITVDRLRMLPQWHVLVLYRAALPVIVRIKPVWTRKDVRLTAARAHERTAA